MKQITPTIKKFAENFYSKFAKGMNKSLGTSASSKVIGTAVKAIVVANLADTAVKDTPILYNILKGVSSLQAMNIKLQDLTIGKIPGVGQAFTFLRDKLMDFQEFTFGAITPTFTELQQGARETAKKWNDPKFYQHYPKWMSALNISSGYPNTNYSSVISQDNNNVSSIGQVPSIVTYQVVLGFPHSRNVAENRFNTMYALTKAARGLSSTSYTYEDVKDYFIAITAIQLIHSCLNKVLSLVVAADPAKPRMPRVALYGMGFNIDEVTEHLAEYLEFHKYLVGIMNTSGFVSWGHLSDKIKSSETFLKDSKQKIATYYNINYVLPNSYTTEDGYIGEITFNLATQGNGGGRTVSTLASIKKLFNMWLAVFTKNKAISDFKSDILGCLGSENALTLEIRYENKFKTALYDELGLSSIKNADMDAAGTMFIGGQQALTKRVAYYCNLSADLFGTVRVQSLKPASTSNTVQLPMTPALKYAQLFDSVAYPAQIVTNRFTIACHKDKLEDGEVSEVLSKRIRGFNIVPRDVGSEHYISREFFPICDLIIGSVFDQGDSDGFYDENEFGYLNPRSNNETSDDYFQYASMYWSLLDWSPALVLGGDLGTPGGKHTITLWDMDNIGSVSKYSLEQTSIIIDYSLLDPNIKVTGERGKQIQNLIDLYSK